MRTIGHRSHNRHDRHGGSEISIIDPQRPRWRFRLSSLMLLVVIAALSIALVVEQLNAKIEIQRAMANKEMALIQAREAIARA